MRSRLDHTSHKRGTSLFKGEVWFHCSFCSWAIEAVWCAAPGRGHDFVCSRKTVILFAAFWLDAVEQCPFQNHTVMASKAASFESFRSPSAWLLVRKFRWMVRDEGKIYLLLSFRVWKPGDAIFWTKIALKSEPFEIELSTETLVFLLKPRPNE